MNKNIKKLIEGLFDDELFNIDDIELNIDLTNTTFKYYPKTKEELQTLIKNRIENESYDCNLNDIYTGYITDMSRLFMDYEWNGDISKWDVSRVKDMSRMFYGSWFNGDISKWDVSNVTNMSNMFQNSNFNENINDWQVSNVENMYEMFQNARNFNKELDKWDVSNVTNMAHMFSRTSFNQDIRNWNINPKCNTSDMFSECRIWCNFKPKLPMNEGIFDDELFNSDNIGSDVDLTKAAYKYQPETKNELVKIITEIRLHNGSESDTCSLNDIDTSKITDMSFLFHCSKFNGDISEWDVSNVTDMSNMFSDSDFNGDISKWDVSKVKTMQEMFSYSEFNRDISLWNISNVTNMRSMFSESAFNQNLNNWKIDVNKCDTNNIFDNNDLYGQSDMHPTFIY